MSALDNLPPAQNRPPNVTSPDATPINLDDRDSNYFDRVYFGDAQSIEDDPEAPDSVVESIENIRSELGINQFSGKSEFGLAFFCRYSHCSVPMNKLTYSTLQPYVCAKFHKLNRRDSMTFAYLAVVSCDGKECVLILCIGVE